MLLSTPIRKALHLWSVARRDRAPDRIIFNPDSAVPYMKRWWVIPRNRFINCYLNEVYRSDEDRAHHDHPWMNISIVLWGGYWEHRILAGGIVERKWRAPGTVKIRWSSAAAHRLEIPDGQMSLSLFLTGPKVRAWGFHDAGLGWVHNQVYKGMIDRGETAQLPATGNLPRLSLWSILPKLVYRPRLAIAQLRMLYAPDA